MSPPPGRPKEGSLPLGGTARSAQGAPMSPPPGRPKEGSLPLGQRQQVWRAWQELDAWPGFASALERLRRALPVVSFTMLPTAMVMNVSRRNGLVWDAVISCEMIGVYKAQPEAYATAARWLSLEPSQILMVACHNFDLNGAHAAGFRTAFVRRPDEWGPEGPPDPNPNMRYDFVEDDFDGLVRSVMSQSTETAPAPREGSNSSGAAQVR